MIAKTATLSSVGLERQLSPSIERMVLLVVADEVTLFTPRRRTMRTQSLRSPRELGRWMKVAKQSKTLPCYKQIGM
jgi:hypothetical protein